MQCCIGIAQWCYEMLKGHLGVFYWCWTCVVKKLVQETCFCVAACVHTFFPSMMDHILKLRCHAQAKGSGELVEGHFFVSSVTAMPFVLRGWRLWVQTTRNWHPSIVVHIYGKHIGSGFSFQSIYFHSCINFIHY